MTPNNNQGGTPETPGVYPYQPGEALAVREQAAAVAALVMVDDPDAALTAADGDYLAVQSAAAIASLLWAVWQRNDPDGWADMADHMAADLRRLAAGARLSPGGPPPTGPDPVGGET